MSALLYVSWYEEMYRSCREYTSIFVSWLQMARRRSSSACRWKRAARKIALSIFPSWYMALSIRPTATFTLAPASTSTRMTAMRCSVGKLMCSKIWSTVRRSTVGASTLGLRLFHVHARNSRSASASPRITRLAMKHTSCRTGSSASSESDSDSSMVQILFSNQRRDAFTPQSDTGKSGHSQQ
jgi:hypothetical protein